jgi:penicillin-binding protein 1C
LCGRKVQEIIGDTMQIKRAKTYLFFFLKSIAITTGIFVVLLLLLHIAFPFRYKVSYAQTLLSDEGEIIATYLSADDKWRMYVPLSEITPDLRKAIVAKEDRFFYYHFGINPFAIVRATFNNVLKSKKTSGASTITMQVARLLVPKQRTYTNKLVEIFRALQLELTLSKDEILQLYLNLVPYGGNIEGVKAAAALYFGKSPQQLSVAEIAALAMIPNKPTTLSLSKNNKEAITAARNKLLYEYAKNGIFSYEMIEDALEETFVAERKNIPNLIPHLGNWLHARYGDVPILKTCIRSHIQHKITAITAAYIANISKYGIHNAAVLVIDNQSHEVVGYVGSPDFNDNTHAGQVDGVRAIRSPGSTLKPLIYAVGFDKGYFTPKTVMTDVPTDFDGYSPENFDLRFHGSITIEKALAKSLNVTAVKALEQIGVEPFVGKMMQAGFKSMQKQQKNVGLSLALGGCGVSLEEMTNLYSIFANKGVFHSLRYLKEDTAYTSLGIVSEEAVYMTTEILTQIERPDFPNNYQNSSSAPHIAWKTGTSYGRRDAWSIGYNQKYTIGVWLGNFNAQGVQELTGAGMATPLLFKLFQTITYRAGEGWFAQPDNLKTRVVCAQTGLVPLETCQTLVSDYFIAGVSPIQTCAHQKYYFVSPDETKSYCSHCLPASQYKKKLYPNYPTELITYFEAEKMPYLRVPPHNTSCSYDNAKSKPPIITSPIHKREYTMLDEATELMLSCQTSNNVTTVYWYIDNVLYSKVKPTERVFFKPQKGKIKISCTDDKGQNANITITVK